MSFLRKVTDSIGVTKKVTGVLHIPIEISTNHTELHVYTWPSGEKSFVPPTGIIELYVRVKFTGEPFPVGTTVAISTDRFPCDPEDLDTPGDSRLSR